MKYLNDSYEMSQENASYMSRTHQYISRIHMKYPQDTDLISPGHQSNITRTPLKLPQDPYQISPILPSNFSSSPIKYF